jgi:subtilisin-like proprotein convertase family protein
MKSRLAVSLLLCCTFLAYNCSSDKEAPTISITAPLDGDTIAVHTSLISAQASDNSEVEYVEFYVDNALIGTDSNAPYESNWSIASYGDLTAHSIDGTAYDAAGNAGQSDIVLVTVVNRGSVRGTYTDTALVYDGTWAVCDVAIADAPDSALVDSIMVSVDILHSSLTDLDVYLQSPSTTEHQLWDNDFSGLADTITTALFADEDVNGTWLLRINDEVTNGLGGFATNFEIQIFWKY